MYLGTVILAGLFIPVQLVKAHPLVLLLVLVPQAVLLAQIEGILLTKLYSELNCRTTFRLHLIGNLLISYPVSLLVISFAYN
jgi:hypothetical protein